MPKRQTACLHMYDCTHVCLCRRESHIGTHVHMCRKKDSLPLCVCMGGACVCSCTQPHMSACVCIYMQEGMAKHIYTHVHESQCIFPSSYFGILSKNGCQMLDQMASASPRAQPQIISTQDAGPLKTKICAACAFYPVCHIQKSEHAISI